MQGEVQAAVGKLNDVSSVHQIMQVGGQLCFTCSEIRILGIFRRGRAQNFECKIAF